MNIATKISILFVLLVFVPLIFTSTLTYVQAKQQMTASIHNQLESIATIQKARVIGIIESFESQLALVQARIILRNALERYQKEGKEEDRETVRRIIDDVPKQTKIFQEISIVEPKGRVVASTNRDNEGRDWSQHPAFLSAWSKSGIVDIVKEPEHRIVILLSGPLMLDSKFIGVVIIKVSPDDLFAVTSDYTGLGKTGETLLAKKDREGNAVFIAPTRDDKDAALKVVVQKEKTEVPITTALTGKEQTMPGIDYMGVQVIGATRYVEKTAWGIVAKIDIEEAYAPVYSLRKQMLVTIVITFIFVMLIGLATARSIAMPIKNLTEVIDEISRGKLDAEIDENIKQSKDETGALARAFERTIVSLKLAMKLKKENGNNGKNNKE